MIFFYCDPTNTFPRLKVFCNFAFSLGEHPSMELGQYSTNISVLRARWAGDRSSRFLA